VHRSGKYVNDVDLILADSDTPVKSVSPERERELRLAIEELYFGYRAFTALPDRILAERGLGRTHHRLLYFVCRDPGISVGELLSVLRISKQAANRPLRELEQQGLLAAVSDARDRRIRRLSPTAAGVRLEAALSAAQMRQLEAAFGNCGQAAEQHWRQVMAELRRAED
jgi:DNA-binding MarR family transcriptional regulator